MNSLMTSIDRKLRDWEIASAVNNEELVRKLCNEIYKIVLTQNLDLWDERILLGLERLLDVSPPSEKVHGETMRALRERTRKVRAINDLLYHIIEPETEIKRIIDKLSGFVDLPNARKEKLWGASTHGGTSSTRSGRVFAMRTACSLLKGGVPYLSGFMRAGRVPMVRMTWQAT